MAKFSATISDPKSSASPVAPVMTPSATTGIAEAVSSGLQVFDVIQKAEKQRKTEAAITDATTSILDLQDETIGQQLESDKVRSQVAGIYSDGEVTPEEQTTLDELQKQIGKFELLDPNRRQLRMNTLHRQALANVQNLGIQLQINSLFGQGRSNALQPTTTARENFNQSLDLKYGAGNWGPVEEGREIGKKVFAEEQIAKAKTHITSIQGEGSLTASQAFQDTIREAGTVYAQQGHLRDDQATMFIATLEGRRNTMKQDLLALQNDYAARGIDVSAQVKGLLEDIDNDFDHYSAMFIAKGLFGDAVRTKRVLSDAVATMDNLRELRLPVSSKALSSLIGGGSGGGIKALHNMLNASDSVLMATMEDNPALAQYGSPKQLKENMAAYIAMTLNPMSVEQAINQGYIAPQLAKVTSSNFGIRNSDTPEQLDNNLTPFDMETSPDTALGEIEALIHPENVAAVKELGSTRMGSIAIHKAEAIMADISPAMRELIRVNEQGILEIPVEGVPVGKANARYFNRLLAAYTKYIDTYAKELEGGREKWLQEFLPEEESDTTSSDEE